MNVQKLKNKEIFEVIKVEGKKVINRLGFFSEVDEGKPYAWFKHANPIVDVDANLDDLFDVNDGPGEILAMEESDIVEKIKNFLNITPLNMADVSIHTPCGFYFES